MGTFLPYSQYTIPQSGVRFDMFVIQVEICVTPWVLKISVFNVIDTGNNIQSYTRVKGGISNQNTKKTMGRPAIHWAGHKAKKDALSWQSAQLIKTRVAAMG